MSAFVEVSEVMAGIRTQVQALSRPTASSRAGRLPARGMISKLSEEARKPQRITRGSPQRRVSGLVSHPQSNLRGSLGILGISKGSPK
jgi:hypothetical protein